MLKASDFKTVSVQAAVFTFPQQGYNPSNIIRILLGNHGDIFNGEIETNPLPHDFPNDLKQQAQHLKVQSKDLHWLLTSAPVRSDCFWNATDNETQLDDPLEKAGVVISIIESLLSGGELPVSRIGLVIKRRFFTENPEQELIGHFCKGTSVEGPFRNSKGFEVKNLKQYSLGSDLEINSWVKCSTGKSGKPECQAIIFEQDINTQPKPVADPIKLDQISKLFEGFAQKAENILVTDYFPEEN